MAAVPFDATSDLGLGAAMARGVLRQSDQADEAARRQSDGSAFDMRALGAAIGVALVQGDTPGQDSNLNAASHTPYSQPFTVPGYYAAPQPTSSVPNG